MRRHEVCFVVDAPPEKVWRLFHPAPPPGSATPRLLEHPGGTVEILFEGDEAGQGLVRTCTFRVPRYLLSGGRARSWEVIIEARKHEISRYRAVGKPLWSQVEGWHTLERLDDGRTRLMFVETYHAHNPILRLLFEGRVHRFISRDNDRVYETLLRYCGAVSRER